MDIALPKWLTLDQAAAWLTIRTEAAGIKWTEDMLLSVLTTTIGPGRDLHTVLPIWLSANSTLHIQPHDGLPEVPIIGEYLRITQKTLQRFHTHATMDSAAVAVWTGDNYDDAGESLQRRLVAGVEIPRAWLVVQGFDLIMFLMAYANVMKRMQQKSSVSTTMDAAPSTSGVTTPAALPATKLAELFDGVGTAALEKMFATSSGAKWKALSERAARNGLDKCRVSRSKFNPLLAAEWWLYSQNPPGWDWARCLRVLANNLPVRSAGQKYLLIDE